MFKTFNQIRRLLDGKQRTRALLIALLMIITAFAQMAGIASVMPFLGVVADPSIVERNEWLSRLNDILGFESTASFLYFLGIVAFVIFMLSIALQALTDWVVTRFSHMQQYNLARRLMAVYLQRPYTFFLTRNSGDLTKTLLHETTQVVGGALMPFMRLVGYALSASAVVVLLIAVKPVLAIVVAIGLGSIYAAVYLVARGWLQRIGQQLVTANAERYTSASEALAGAKEIRLLGRENAYLERFRKPSFLYARNVANSTILGNLPQYVIEAIAFGGVILLVLFMLRDGTLADVLPLIGLYALAGKQLIPALQRIFAAVSSLRFNGAVVENLLSELESNTGVAPSRTGDSERRLAPLHAIRACGVTYSYPDSEAPALNNLDLEIPARQTVGFVGASGAGKSTLIDLLLGLLPPDQGEIRIDDTPLSPENVRAWQACIGYVPQHIFLADQSIAANIALGVPLSEIDRDAVEHAARLASLHDFVIRDLPDGYDTVIGERGVRLSGGQRQRIGIARALYRDPPVLLFDEATSALDNNTEQAVMAAIHQLAGNKTIILVAHRLSTVQPCDLIIVLEAGRVIESGRWDELLANGGSFSRLATSQT